MKKINLIIIKLTHVRFIVVIFAMLSLLLLIRCKKDKDNQLPTLTFTAPASLTAERGDELTITVNATDPDGQVKELTLLIDQVTVTKVTTDSLSYKWNTADVSAGTHEITCNATDDQNDQSSKSITITLSEIVLGTPSVPTINSEVGQLTLTWPAVTKALTYNVFWTDDGSSPTESSNSQKNITSTQLIHTGLDITKQYTYAIQAVNGNVKSSLSGTVAGFIKIPTPLIETSEVGSTVKITWTACGLTGVVYKVNRRNSTSVTYSLLAEVSGTEYIDNTIEAGKGYYYTLQIVDASKNRSSDVSNTKFGAVAKVIAETERNNDNIKNFLLYDTHYYDAEEVTLGLDYFRITGAYSGSYSIYSATSYRNAEVDAFRLDTKVGDVIQFRLISGNMSALWGMDVDIHHYGRYTSGSNYDFKSYSFNYPSDTWTYKNSGTGTTIGAYIAVSMWDDLINTGPYYYEIEIKIVRK